MSKLIVQTSSINDTIAFSTTNKRNSPMLGGARYRSRYLSAPLAKSGFSNTPIGPFQTIVLAPCKM
jgi:hypothetical protein